MEKNWIMTLGIQAPAISIPKSHYLVYFKLDGLQLMSEVTVIKFMITTKDSITSK